MLRTLINIALILGLTLQIKGQSSNFSGDSTATDSAIKIEIPQKIKQLPFGLKVKVPADIPKVGIALSGGGSRGFVHIATLEALEKAGIPIEYIVGTSMGAIIGGLYSAGYDLRTLKDILFNSDWAKFTSPKELKRSQLFVDQKLAEDRAILTFRLDGLKPVIPTSISSGQSISSFLNTLVLNAPIHVKDSFDELLYKFRAVSTNLVNGKEVILNKGSLTRAMRASASVSFFLPPVKYDSLMLVDGGLVANIPAQITRRIGSDVVIGSNATSPLRKENELNYPWEVAEQLVSIPMERLTTQNLQVVDLLIQPELKGINNRDFTKVMEIYSAGRKAAEPQINKIKELYRNFFEHSHKNNSKIIKVDSIVVDNELKDYLNDLTGDGSVDSGDILFVLNEILRTGKFKDVWAEIDSSRGFSLLKINYKLNDPVTGLKIKGTSLPDEFIDSRKYFSGLINKPFNPVEIVDSALSLLRQYRKLGYPLVEIDSIYFSNGALGILLNEHPINKITIIGNEKTNADVITREFPIKEGDPLKIGLIKEGLTNLQATNLFSDVEADIRRTNGHYELIITVIEKKTNLLRLGLRIDNENFTQVFADLREENLFGSGTELGIIFGGGTRGRSFVIEQKSNRIFDTYLTYKIRLYSRFNDVNVYKNDSTTSESRFERSKSGEYRQIYSGVSFGLGTQAEKFGNLFVEGRYESNEVKNKLDYLGETYLQTISAIKFSLFIDSQNKIPYPTKGFLINSYYETAQTKFGGEVGYTKFFINYKSYFSLNTNNTFAPSFTLGFGDETLPLAQQFSLGGQYSFFGLRNDEFRGRQVFSSSLEYRTKLPFKIFFDTYLKFRYDLGSIWETQQSIRFKDLRHGIGATISFDTPLGQADFSIGRSFYFANRLEKQTIVRGPVYFYFTIGY